MLVILSAVVLAVAVVLFVSSRDGGKHFPPGPPGIPVLGNMFEIDPVDPRKTWARWHQQYGPIFRLKIASTDLIILGSIPMAKELFGRRGAQYSSRPEMIMAREVMTKNMQTATLLYGDKWKTHNRIQLSLLNARVLSKSQALIQTESRRTLVRLLTAKDLMSCFNRLKFNIIYTLAYGKDPEQNEEDFHEILDLADSFAQALTNGTWLVDVFPILNHLPTFMAPWKKYGDRFFDRAHRWFAKNTADAMDTKDYSWTKDVMNGEISKDLKPVEIRSLIGVLFEAGIDSTATALHYFVLACILNPDAVARARKELDNVVGSSRLPTAEDLPDMPYVKGFAKEVLRWRQISLSLPHRTTADDEYMGYRIRKGSLVLFNQWQGHLDEALFPDPQAFRPERYSENPDLPLGVFGYGRRACPGQYLAMMTLETMIAGLLWAYDFHSTADLSAHKDALHGAFADGAFLKPLDFPVTWKLRDEECKGVLEDELRVAENQMKIANNTCRE